MQDLLATWKEGDLYNEWVPNCYASKTIKEIGRSEMLLWFALRTLPIIDLAVHGFGVDALSSGYFLILAKHASQKDWPDNPIPRKRGLRVAFSGLQVMIEPVGPTSVRSCLVASLDTAQTPLPDWLLNFTIKYLMGVLFYVQAKCAQKMRARPERSSHARLVASKPHFYRDWLSVKVDRYRREKGWIA